MRFTGFIRCDVEQRRLSQLALSGTIGGQIYFLDGPVPIFFLTKKIEVVINIKQSLIK